MTVLLWSCWAKAKHRRGDSSGLSSLRMTTKMSCWGARRRNISKILRDISPSEWQKGNAQNDNKRKLRVTEKPSAQPAVFLLQKKEERQSFPLPNPISVFYLVKKAAEKTFFCFVNINVLEFRNICVHSFRQKKVFTTVLSAIIMNTYNITLKNAF